MTEKSFRQQLRDKELDYKIIQNRFFIKELYRRTLEEKVMTTREELLMTGIGIAVVALEKAASKQEMLDDLKAFANCEFK